MISKDHSKLSITNKFYFLEIHRFGIYYKLKQGSELNFELMTLMDEHYNYHPLKKPQACIHGLPMQKVFEINHKPVERLYYDVMGVIGVYNYDQKK